LSRGMGKSRKNKSSSDQALATSINPGEAPAPCTVSLREWVSREPRGMWWLVGSIAAGFALGCLLGAGWLERKSSGASTPDRGWRQDAADRLRSTRAYRWTTGNEGAVTWKDWIALPFNGWHINKFQNRDAYLVSSNPSHPRIFALLRESVVRERGGYVHPDLGFLVPAPSGAARGIGMVRDSYHKCQIQCLPGLANEKLRFNRNRQSSREVYMQEDILLRIPLDCQMTRKVALDTLLSIVPSSKHPVLYELDDAALLVLLLAHERGVGRFSPWMPYIASLPPEPSCGYSKRLRPYMMDAIEALRDEYGVDTQGFTEQLFRATQYAHKIAVALSKEYGAHIEAPRGLSMTENIEWALCQVASRATAGTAQHGSLRLIPMVDQINHDANAGGFIELTGKERLENGDFLDTTEDDSGAFVVRSLRHGRRKALRKGQELLANYNVPHYAPLDWFVSLGFLPPERQTPWQKIDPVLPRIRRDGPFAHNSIPTSQMWNEKHLGKFHEFQKSEL
jgi:hypothetical protein